MAQEGRRLTVYLSDAALQTLDQIWDWNAENYGSEHADRYVELLRSELSTLATDFLVGRPVPTRPELKYVTIRRRRKGHGRIAVYRIIENDIYVLNLFHTAQDCQKRLSPRRDS